MSIEVYDYGRAPEHWFVALDIASDISAWSPDTNARDLFCWLEAHEFDVAFVEDSDCKIVRREHLEFASKEKTIGDFSESLPSSNLLDEGSSLANTLDALKSNSWIAITPSNGTTPSGIVTLEDIAKPAASAYFLAHLIILEQGLRRLLGSYSSAPLPDEPEPFNKDRENSSTVYYLRNLKERVEQEKPLLADLDCSKTKFGRVMGRSIHERNNLAHSRRLGYDSSKPAETLTKFSEIQDLLSRVIELLKERPQIWQAFSKTQIVNPDNSICYAGTAATDLPFDGNNYVITAANPYEQVLTAGQNKIRNEMFRKVLERRTGKIKNVVGRSPDGSWQEVSFLISGIDELELLKLAKDYGQRAIFKLTDQDKIVMSPDGKVQNSTCRFE